jgi:integrase
MSTARISMMLDKRTVRKGNRFTLSLRVIFGKKIWYISLGTKYTEKEYREIFEGPPTEETLPHKIKATSILQKAESIISMLHPFDWKRFKSMLYENDSNSKPISLFLDDRFKDTILSKKANGQISGANTYKVTLNTMKKFSPNAQVKDVTPQFLQKFELWMLSRSNGNLTATLGINMRNLRAVINAAINQELVGIDYKYPFGRGKYSIPHKVRDKRTHTISEIESLVEYKEFLSPQEEKSRDIWLILFYCNGLNFIDLLQLKWENLTEDAIVLYRQKTKNTSRNNPTPIRIPIIPGLRKLIEKHGNKNSPYLLGYLSDGATMQTIHNKNKKIAKLLNLNLKKIGRRLNFSEPLICKTARYAYATTLKNKGVPIGFISEQMGHSNIIVTQKYLSSFEHADLIKNNSLLPQ